MSLAEKLTEWAENKRKTDEAKKILEEAETALKFSAKAVIAEVKHMNRDVTFEWEGKSWYVHINYQANQISMKEVEAL